MVPTNNNVPLGCGARILRAHACRVHADRVEPNNKPFSHALLRAHVSRIHVLSVNQSKHIRPSSGRRQVRVDHWSARPRQMFQRLAFQKSLSSGPGSAFHVPRKKIFGLSR